MNSVITLEYVISGRSAYSPPLDHPDNDGGGGGEEEPENLSTHSPRRSLDDGGMGKDQDDRHNDIHGGFINN